VGRKEQGETMEKPHRRLKAWQFGMNIAVDVYKATERFPSEEKFGLTSQMRRCGISIPSNTCPVK
jgi:23S rRNA-intervening sequence protein